MANETIRLLLIEDNPGDVTLIRRMLGASTGPVFEVRHAYTLEGALERLKSETVDVILLDLGLPDSDGFQTFSSAAKAAPGIPIIVLSGSEGTQTVLDCIRAGAKDYFVKSRIDPGRLLQAVRR